MAETPEKDPLEELFAIYKERTGESILDRFFRLREETASSDKPLSSDDPDDREETFWDQATDAAARAWGERERNE